MTPAACGRLFRLSLPVGFAAILSGACATLQVPVGPPPIADTRTISESEGGVFVEVRPLDDVDSYLEVFDDYLPDIGVAAVWVTLRCSGASGVDLRKATWHLRASGHESKALTVDKLFGKYYRGRGVRLYSTHTDRQARRAMAGMILAHRAVAPKETVRGYLFLPVSAARSGPWTQGATLVLRSAVVAPDSNVNLELPLSDARP